MEKVAMAKCAGKLGVKPLTVKSDTFDFGSKSRLNCKRLKQARLDFKFILSEYRAAAPAGTKAHGLDGKQIVQVICKKALTIPVVQWESLFCREKHHEIGLSDIATLYWGTEYEQNVDFVKWVTYREDVLGCKKKSLKKHFTFTTCIFASYLSNEEYMFITAALLYKLAEFTNKLSDFPKALKKKANKVIKVKKSSIWRKPLKLPHAFAVEYLNVTTATETELPPIKKKKFDVAKNQLVQALPTKLNAKALELIGPYVDFDTLVAMRAVCKGWMVSINLARGKKSFHSRAQLLITAENYLEIVSFLQPITVSSLKIQCDRIPDVAALFGVLQNLFSALQTVTIESQRTVRGDISKLNVLSTFSNLKSVSLFLNERDIYHLSYKYFAQRVITEHLEIDFGKVNDLLVMESVLNHFQFQTFGDYASGQICDFCNYARTNCVEYEMIAETSLCTTYKVLARNIE